MFLHCAAHLAFALALAPFILVGGCCQPGQHDSHSVLVSLSLSLSLLSISFSVSQSVCLFVALQCICLASVSRDWGHSFVLIPCKLWDWQRGQRVDSSEALHINRVLKRLWNRNVIGKGSIRHINTDYILFNHGSQASSALAWYLPANQ